MWFSSRSHNRQPSTSRESRRAQGSSRRRAAFRPALAVLEDRRLLSTLTVTNNSDSGPGSLRAEIAAAQGGDTIHFTGNLAGQTITLTSGLLEIDKNLTIQGPGADRLAISGNGASGVFLVDAPGNLNVSGLTLDNCNSGGAGGAIYNDYGGTMTISDCSITGNTAYGNGGGIYNGGTMTVSGCTITGNTSRVQGGGIYNGGTLTVSASTITGNSAGQGGGIYSSDGSVDVTHGSTVCGNTAAYGEDDLHVFSGTYSISKNSDVCVIFA
jgi:predicted outer membrane repeat protein